MHARLRVIMRAMRHASRLQVATDMGNMAADVVNVPGLGPDLQALESVQKQFDVLQGLTPDKSGAFLSYTGDALPW
jgi:hypothetical protein